MIFPSELRFDEEEHPRDEHGRFTSKGGDSTGARRAKTVNTLKKKKGDYTNKKFKITAHLNSRSIKKLDSGKALNKSLSNGFTESEHFEAASKVNTLFQKATRMTSGKDKNGSPDIISVKRFYADFKLKSGKKATAKITVKESKQNGHTIYSVELYK